MQEINTESRLKQTVAKINKTVSDLLDSIELIYTENQLSFNLKKQFAHKVIMTLLAPVELYVQFNMNMSHYFMATRPPQMVQHNQLNSAFVFKNESQPEELPSSKIRNPQPRRGSKFVQPYSFPEAVSETEQQGQIGGLMQNNMLGIDAELELSRWAVQTINEGGALTQKDLRQRAMEISDNPSFKAPRKWLLSYFKRFPSVGQLVRQSAKNIWQARGSKKYAQLAGQHQEFSQQFNGQMSNFSSMRIPENTMRTSEISIYDDGEQKIIIDKSITNQIKESKYTHSSRYRKSFVNGNGYKFKNHSRFKNQYFNQKDRKFQQVSRGSKDLNNEMMQEILYQQLASQGKSSA